MNIKKIENENSHNKIDKSSSFEKRATLLKGIFLGLSVVAVVIGLQIIYATQWIGPPTGALPGTQNIAAPINVGTITQTKQGGLNIMGDVGIGTATPGAKLHIAGTPGVDGIMFPDGTLQTTKAIAGAEPCLGVPGAVEGNCFLDVDGDGKSPGWGDCNELCPNCYVGFVGGFSTPDGHDNNCNGIVDEGTGLVRACNVGHVLWSAATSACSSWCHARGSSAIHVECDRRQPRGPVGHSSMCMETCTSSGTHDNRWVHVCWSDTPITCLCEGSYL